MTVRRTREFRDWLASISDPRTKARIDTRLYRLEAHGALGITRSVGGGVYEMKLDFGPGYRIYYTIDAETVTLLLVGGTKKSQAKILSEHENF